MIWWWLYWLALLSAAMATVYLVVDRWSHEELDQHNREVKQRINQVELEYLKTKKTRSRILKKPDL